MTLSKQVLFLTFSMAFLVLACGEKDAAVRDAARESLPQKAPQDMLQQASQPLATGTVYHYTCPNGCEGGGGDSQGTCPVCNTALVHNQAYHTQQTNQQMNTQNTMQNNTAATGQNSAGIFHYVCPDGHPGGAASSGSCATCGKALVHNQAYHNTSAATNSTTTNNSMDLQQLMQQQQQQSTQTTTPAQNAAGVYHYTCANGCAGGAASAVACASCGATLVHNQAYHN